MNGQMWEMLSGAISMVMAAEGDSFAQKIERGLSTVEDTKLELRAHGLSFIKVEEKVGVGSILIMFLRFIGGSKQVHELTDFLSSIQS